LANSPPLSEVIDFNGNNVFVNNSVNAFSVSYPKVRVKHSFISQKFTI